MRLKSYLVLLATDVGHLARHFADPVAAAEEAGLSKEDRTALFSGDQNLLYANLIRPAHEAESK